MRGQLLVGHLPRRVIALHPAAVPQEILDWQHLSVVDADPDCKRHIDLDAPVITAALQRRLRSRAEAPFADKLLAALRNQFGGHAVRKD